MGSKGNVLIVDDEQLILTMAKDLLSKAGYVVQTASNTIGAGYLLRDFNPDLVVLDIMLPGSLSGDQACDTLKTFKPDLKIILYSGIDEVQLEKLGKKHKADAVISKGCRPSVLLQAVERLLDVDPK